ncbi:NAD(P)/FAD-dependent oxidoreductase [Maribacter hydrothermalis]|uniref:FAD-dependent oxidoreductase n=1 Tax=Maribacter hydrothermalis TaxID=1836467 RepID=A0A1B7Z8M2_9FLAO|nr:NAD(P)/FAD-dependent oxidoreductase [Maribacter hydrothermalis]APQ19078.1 FAD-dependent oxidoreductase [Maribacter hydrothermalis]OBR38910.1 FAD-dependent oxidoreductase [Maribacter hydrothermalis]
MKEHDILIIGGGLAGLTAAIHLAIEGKNVAVFEMNAYPNHKVCGEYISKEIEPYLNRLGVKLNSFGAKNISKFQISTPNGYLVETTLPLGGFGISRYALDDLLYKRAKKLGVVFYFEKVINAVFKKDAFTITTALHTYTAKIVIAAYGKRSILDKKMERAFSQNKNSWLAVKAHYQLDEFSEELVSLHNFEGGYGGLSKTESGAVNFCYLAHYNTFKKYKDVTAFNKEVVAKNPYLKSFLSNAIPNFAQPLTIAQISFDKKDSVVNHMLMCGDTAGLIHPLCGNGMAMAIHSAKIASELVVRFFNEPDYTRYQLELDYKKSWNKTFSNRLWFGRKLQRILMNENMVSIGIRTVGKSQRLLKFIINKTHGELIS